jgi:hypothetical protein
MNVLVMKPRVRKSVLTAHITFSVGWLGAVACFLVLSIAGMTSSDAAVVSAAYVAMNLVGAFAIVPMSVAALTTGLVQGLGTEWGLLRFYWVFVKLLLSIFATILLMLHQFTAVAAAAKRVSVVMPHEMPDVGRLGAQLVGDAGGALFVLLVITTLSVFRPWGRTPYGQRAQKRVRRGAVAVAPDATGHLAVTGLPRGLKTFLAICGVLVAVAAVARHLASGGVGSHGH